jgi:voltage-gated potassium channel Kch
MVATPFLLLALNRLLRAAAGPAPAAAYDEVRVAERSVVIAGFGRFGQIIGRILRSQRIPFTAIEIDPGNVDFVRQYGNEIYYGDAANMRLLRTAEVEKAAAFVCAVGEVEKNVDIIEKVRREFPNIKVFARARNRLHEMRLRAIGVDGVIRDTLLSSVELAGMLLGKLGRSDAEVADIKQTFLENDRATLQKQYMHRENERLLIQTAREAAEELERVFSEDEQAGRR